jgi:hypothetical protein
MDIKEKILPLKVIDDFLKDNEVLEITNIEINKAI